MGKSPPRPALFLLSLPIPSVSVLSLSVSVSDLGTLVPLSLFLLPPSLPLVRLLTTISLFIVESKPVNTSPATIVPNSPICRSLPISYSSGFTKTAPIF